MELLWLLRWRVRVVRYSGEEVGRIGFRGRQRRRVYWPGNDDARCGQLRPRNTARSLQISGVGYSRLFTVHAIRRHGVDATHAFAFDQRLDEARRYLWL